MKIWDDITTTALMGTERHPGKLPVEGTDPLDAALVRVDKQDPDAATLAAAGLVTVYRKAGAKVLEAAVKLPVPAAADTLPECSAKAAHFLAIIFTNGEYRDLVPEALTLVIEAGKRIPPSLLPELLDLGRQNTAIRDALVRVIGNRGTWLAGQNPDWSYAVYAIDVENHLSGSLPFREGLGVGDWAIAPRAARVAALRALGERDSAKARELLQSTWSTESADDRAALLAARIVSLSQDDEEFLESALDDRSALVRQVAADLLARLPESRLVRRMIERLSAVVSVKFKFIGGHTLEIKLPEDCDPSMARDGVESGAPAKSTPNAPAVDEGRKAGWLRQMIAAVPPRHWSSTMNLTQDQFVTLVEKSEWSDPLLRGLAQAAARHPSDEWTLALLRAQVRRPAKYPDPGELTPAITRLPVAKLEPIVFDLLGRGPLGAPGPLRSLLNLYPGTWSPTLTRAVLDKIRKTLADFGDNQTFGAVATLLRDMVLKIPPSMADDVAQAIANGPIETTYWGRLAEQSLNTLRLRHDLREAILETS